MKRLTLAGLVLAAFLLMDGRVDAGWTYHGGSYTRNASYYGACSYQGYSYQPGYWTYTPDPVYLTTYVYPVYIATAYAQYVPAAGLAPTYQTGPLAAVQPVQQSGTAVATSVQQNLGAGVTTATPAAGIEARLTAVEARLATVAALDAKIDRLLASVEQRQSAPLKAAAPTDSPQDDPRIQAAAALLVRSCAPCHHETVSAKAGGGLALFRAGQQDDKGAWSGVTLLKVGDEVLKDIILRISSTGTDQMPPEKRRDKHPGLTAAEQGEVRWLVERLRAARKKE